MRGCEEELAIELYSISKHGLLSRRVLSSEARGRHQMEDDYGEIYTILQTDDQNI